MLRSPVALLVLALLGAGCVGATLDDAASAPLAADAAAAALLTTAAEWQHAGGRDAFPIGEPVVVPEGAGVVLVDFNATVAGPLPSLEVRALAPDGKEHVVGRLSSLAVSPAATRSGIAWSLLEAAPGEWRFVGLSRTASEGTLAVTVSPKVDFGARVRGAGDDRVVVAVVDTGVNPYHEVFQREGLGAEALPGRIVDPATGEGPLPVRLGRESDYLATLRADAGVWGSVPSETLVHFQDTNLLGYRVGETKLPRIPVLDRAGHGTAVAHAVTQENPDVLVVLVVADDYDDGVRWAASQPWVDLLSLSWGPPVNAVGPAFEALAGVATPSTTKEAYDAGKVVFGASGNDPTPTFTDTTSGPIWVHAVSGSEAAQHGRALLSGNFVDTVANWTQTLAMHTSLDEVRRTSGTSFATPTTAGVASRILHEVRQRAGHEGNITEGALVKTAELTVLNGDLRSALNTTAFYWGTTDFSGDDAVPVAPAPWMSMGWGHVDGSIVPAAVEILLGTNAPPEKPAEARAWMQAHHDLREGSWGG